MPVHVWFAIAFASFALMAYVLWAVQRLPRVRHWLTFFAVVGFVIAAVAQSYENEAMVTAPAQPLTASSLP